VFVNAPHVILRLPVQPGRELRPVGRPLAEALDVLGAPRRPAGRIDQYHGQMVSAKRGGQIARAPDDVVHGVRGRVREEAFLEIDDQKSGGVIECADGHEEASWG